MSSEQQEFAKVVLAAFAKARRHTDRQIGDAGGPSTSKMTTLRKVAAGEQPSMKMRSDTLRRIDAAADWFTGSAHDFWTNGTRPTLDALGHPLSEGEGAAARGPADPTDGYLRRLEARILETEVRLDRVEAHLQMGGTDSGTSDQKSGGGGGATGGLTVVPDPPQGELASGPEPGEANAAQDEAGPSEGQQRRDQQDKDSEQSDE